MVFSEVITDAHTHTHTNKKTTISNVPQEKEMMKQKLFYQQARLHCRGAPEMVLQTISGSRGMQKKKIKKIVLLGEKA